MRRRKVDSGLERQFLIGLVVSKPFLASAAPALDLGLITSDHFRLVASWCLDYFKEYGEAPGKHIEAIFYSWSERQQETPPEVVEAIQDFLVQLSAQYDEASDLNVPYLLDELSNFLSSKKLERLKDEIEYGLLQGDTASVVQSVSKFSAVNLGRGAGVDVLNDPTAWERAFSLSLEPLIEFSGDAGSFLNKAFVREGLIGIQGPEKRGKTWFCIELAVRALRNRKKVAFFEVGDLSEGQIILRLGVRLCSRPLRESQCGRISIPTAIERDGENVSIVTTIKQCDSPITQKSCLEACSAFMRRVGIAQHSPYFMVDVHPTASINVKGIEGILERWETEKGFIPDVIIIDYADILAPEDSSKQSRDQVNDTWKALRRLSQERKCLVIAPTQADSASYTAEIQTMTNFSEDKRKLGHVTGMLGLNQTAEEKERGILRLNWIVLRESPFYHTQCLFVAQCLELGRAFCCSTL